MTSTRISRGELSLFVFLLAGCAAAPQPAATPTPDATPTPSAAPSPSATIATTAAPSAPPEPFTVNWSRSPVNPGALDLVEARRLRPYQGRFALLGSSGRIWTSEDALHWQPAIGIATRKDIEVFDIAVGGPGMVAVGRDLATEGPVGDAAVWTSTDGRAWTEVAHQTVFTNSPMNQVGASSAGLVAFGSTGNGHAWTSTDGRKWAAATDATSRHIAAGLTKLITLDDRVVAFVDRKPRGGALEVWQRSSGAWTKAGDLPSSTGGSVTHAARGRRGWVAIGEVRNDIFAAWTSRDGTHWTRAGDAKALADSHVRYVIALDAGFVAVGFSGEEPDTTCGSGEPIIGHTWTSTDGSTWREMPHEGQFNRALLYALYARNDTLYMLGGFFPAKAGERTTVWTAKLPATAVPAEGARPVRGSPGPGCGP